MFNFAKQLVVGKPRSGKTVKVAIPYLLTWKKAAIIHDVKSSEIWKYTSGFRQQLQEVYRFAPTERNSCKINPLDLIRYGTSKENNDIDCIVDDITSSIQNIRERGMIKQFLFETISRKDVGSLSELVCVSGYFHPLIGSEISRLLRIFDDPMVAKNTSATDISLDFNGSLYLCASTCDSIKVSPIFRMVINLLLQQSREMIAVLDECRLLGDIHIDSESTNSRIVMFIQKIDGFETVAKKCDSIVDEKQLENLKAYYTNDEFMRLSSIPGAAGRSIEHLN